MKCMGSIFTTVFPLVSLCSGAVYYFGSVIGYLKLSLIAISIIMFIFASIVGISFIEEVIRNTPEEITFDKILIWAVAICAGYLGFYTIFGTSNGDVMIMVLMAEFVAIAIIIAGVLRRRHINHRK